MQYTFGKILSDFLSDGFLIFFKNIEMSIELYNGGKSVAQPSVVMARRLYTADGLPVLNGTAVVKAMY